MKTQILEQASAQQALLEQIIENQKLQMAGYQNLMKKASHVSPLIEKELQKMGLDVANFSICDFNLKRDYTGEDSSILIQIQARPNSGKFKFIKDTGYDRQGRGRNQKSLDAKAKKMSETLESACKCPCEVNSFSLERKRTTEIEQIVLISVWVRA